MKILIISTRLPHPKVVSGHLIVYQRLRRLAARGHEVSLAVFSSDDDAQHVDAVKPFLRELEIVPRPRPRPFLRCVGDFLFSKTPSRFVPYASDDMFRRVGDLVERLRCDVAIAEFGFMGPYLNRNPYLSAVRKIVSVHQCQTIATQKAVDLLGFSPRVVREWFAIKGLRRFEFDTYHCADRVLVLSPEERFGLLNEAPDLRITVIPSGVDTEFFQPGDPAQKEQALVFTGFYTDEPNRDAVIWFCRSVWPRLSDKYPQLKFYVVGPKPTPDMLDLARKDPRIVVTGEVEDIRPYLHRARVFVCPNRMGSGMRGKILQAMACGVPVVSTTLGAEGINIQMCEDGFLADKPRIISQYIDLLLGDEALQSAVARRARELVVDRFSWDRGLDLLENVLEDVVRGR